MPERKPFLIRIDPVVLEALQRWADDDLRSLNGQIEWVLRWALQEAGRARPNNDSATSSDSAQQQQPIRRERRDNLR